VRRCVDNCFAALSNYCPEKCEREEEEASRRRLLSLERELAAGSRQGGEK
jgi:hypothetical protein